MIFVDRNRVTETGEPIKPDGSWDELSKNATNDILDDPTIKANRYVYSHPQVKYSLADIFHEKCAYCESKLGLIWDVDHFRPKGNVKEDDGHGGYYWLAYAWDNLYPACADCNRIRKDRFSGTVKGKGDYFPLSDNNASRAYTPDDNIADEEYVLIDPCNDNPEEYLDYNSNGTIIALNDNSRGNKSIEIFHLFRGRLKRCRKEHIDFICKMIYETNADVKKICEIFDNYQTEYIGLTRAIAADPRSFGIEE